jgi:RNA recognition motif-containing protein
MIGSRPSIESREPPQLSFYGFTRNWENAMGRKLYVGNLPYSATEQSLETTFAAHGTVESVKLVMDRDTGRSKGFGFIEMGSDSEAGSAITALNGSSVEGRPIVVNEARPQSRKSGGGQAHRNRW